MTSDRVESTNKAFLDLENPLHRKVFEEENYDSVWNNLTQFGITNQEKAYLFLDEVQHLPQISKVVKYLYDHWKVKFFLTGSSSYYLKNLFPESLAGRKIIFEMFPLTFQEFLRFKGKERNIVTSFAEKATKKIKSHLNNTILTIRNTLNLAVFQKLCSSRMLNANAYYFLKSLLHTSKRM